MNQYQLYRLLAMGTFTLFTISLFVPVAEITILPRDPDSDLYLAFICVYCQYGNVDSQGAGGGFTVLRHTAFNFFNVWIFNLILIFSSMIPAVLSLEQIKPAFITPKRAMYSAWFTGIIGIGYRGLLSLLLLWKVDSYQAQYPTSQVLGDLSWAMGAIVVGTLASIFTAMLTYIIYFYDDDPSIKHNQKKPYYQ